MKKKSSNKSLRKASSAKTDEFYTQLSDIEKELRHYKDQFRGMVVYCNCDDPFESNFFKYFSANFNALGLGLKKLITTSYVKSPIVGRQLPLFEMKGLKPKGKEPFKIEINEVPDADSDGAVSLSDVEWLLRHDANASTSLKDGGDFRSEECIDLLKQANVVVTNPPFSLFREYVAQLIAYKKKFLIIGNMNALTYKEIFALIKENKIWLGYIHPEKFIVPDYYEEREYRSWRDENGTNWRSLGNACWFTNLDVEKRHEDLILYKKYNSEQYPKYDNHDAINVDKVNDIPGDYKGAIGVPITFLEKYNPEQFELLGIMNTGEINKGIRHEGTPHGRPVINGVEKYLRILIRNKKL